MRKNNIYGYFKRYCKTGRSLITTVSRVLNHDTSLNVTDSTREKIYEAVKRIRVQDSRQRSRNSKRIIRIGVTLVFAEKELGDPY